MSDEPHIAPVIFQIAARVHTLDDKLGTIRNMFYADEILIGSNETMPLLAEAGGCFERALNCLSRAYLAEKLAEGRGGKK